MGLDPTVDDWTSKMDCIKCGRCARECKSNALSITSVFHGILAKKEKKKDT
jgi:ferredoxin